MKQYIVDAFIDMVFKGNPAAVYLLEEKLSKPKSLTYYLE